MPIARRWSDFTFEMLDQAPEAPGVYELGDAKGEIVYIGSSDNGLNIRRRLLFHKKNKPMSVKFFRFEILYGFTESPLRAEQWHCTRFLQQNGRLPRLQVRHPSSYDIGVSRNGSFF